MAALAILRNLKTILGIEVDIQELENSARNTVSQLREAAAVAMGQYIEHFTQPIWESNGDENDDEDSGSEDNGNGDEGR